MKKFYIFHSKLDPQFIPQPGGQLEFMEYLIIKDYQAPK